MIDVNTYEDGLPITVIVPLSKKRSKFFYDFVYPLIEANEPMEIIVNDDIGSAAQKRNAGFKKSTQPFIFCVDDDCLLPASHLKKLHSVLLENPTKGYAYTGYKGIVLHPQTHPMHGNFEIPTQSFNPIILRQHNFISTMALVRRDLFIGFDEKIPMLEDWDLWLSLLDKNIEGIAVPNNEFYAYYLDDGTTSLNNRTKEIESLNYINKKHNIR